MDTIKRQEAIRKRRFTVYEFHKMGDAGVFGEVLEMSPIGWRHMWCVNTLTMLLVPLAKGRYVVSVQNPLVISEHGEPQPDLVLIKDLSPDRLPNSEDVLVEVSDITLTHDKNVKLPRYAAAGVPEVWVLNLQAEAIEVHSRPSDPAEASESNPRQPRPRLRHRRSVASRKFRSRRVISHIPQVAE